MQVWCLHQHSESICLWIVPRPMAISLHGLLSMQSRRSNLFFMICGHFYGFVSGKQCVTQITWIPFTVIILIYMLVDSVSGWHRTPGLAVLYFSCRFRHSSNFSLLWIMWNILVYLDCVCQSFISPNLPICERFNFYLSVCLAFSQLHSLWYGICLSKFSDHIVHHWGLSACRFYFSIWIWIFTGFHNLLICLTCGLVPVVY